MPTQMCRLTGNSRAPQILLALSCRRKQLNKFGPHNSFLHIQVVVSLLRQIYSASLSEVQNIFFVMAMANTCQGDSPQFRTVNKYRATLIILLYPVQSLLDILPLICASYSGIFSSQFSDVRTLMYLGSMTVRVLSKITSFYKCIITIFV